MSENGTCDCGEHECECGGKCSCGCGCESCGDHFQRRFMTKAEQIDELQAYLAELRLEVQAVEERLEDLKK